MRKKELMENAPGKDFDDISTKDFKTTNAQRTKEEFGESQEMMCGQNRNIIKDTEDLGWGGRKKEILDLKRMMNRNEKFTQQDSGRY